MSNMSQSNLSPRRVKPSQATVLFELRALKSAPPATYLSKFEKNLKVRSESWRGLGRWTMQTYASIRGETVLQVIAEKAAQSLRVDNCFASLRRLLLQVLPIKPNQDVAKASNKCSRAIWIVGGGQHSASSWYADVNFMSETYDAACAKLCQWVGDKH